MDVHPTKNGINRYWPIPMWEMCSLLQKFGRASAKVRTQKNSIKIRCFAGSGPANDKFCSSILADIQFLARYQTFPLFHANLKPCSPPFSTVSRVETSTVNRNSTPHGGSNLIFLTNEGLFLGFKHAEQSSTEWGKPQKHQVQGGRSVHTFIYGSHERSFIWGWNLSYAQSFTNFLRRQSSWDSHLSFWRKTLMKTFLVSSQMNNMRFSPLTISLEFGTPAIVSSCFNLCWSGYLKNCQHQKNERPKVQTPKAKSLKGEIHFAHVVRYPLVNVYITMENHHV